MWKKRRDQNTFWMHCISSDYTDPQRIWKQIQFWKTPISIRWHTTVCHHITNICDLLPQEKDNQWSTNTIVNTNHIYVYLFSLLYFNYMHIVTTLSIAIISTNSHSLTAEFINVLQMSNFKVFLLLLLLCVVHPATLSHSISLHVKFRKSRVR